MRGYVKGETCRTATLHLDLNFAAPIIGNLRTSRVAPLLYLCIIARWRCSSRPNIILRLARAPTLLPNHDLKILTLGGWVLASGAGVGLELK